MGEEAEVPAEEGSAAAGVGSGDAGARRGDPAAQAAQRRRLRAQKLLQSLRSPGLKRRGKRG
eukprot:8133069-Pyramimonas_sp.AAC.1